jgi:hypothetical protein
MTTLESTDGSATQALPPTPDRQPHLTARPRKLARVGVANAARVILGVVLAVLLTITWLANNPAVNSGSSPSEWSSDLAQAIVKNELNAGETKGAPQQSVVNGWYANDIAVVQASQNSYIAGSSMRNGNLLALIGFGIAGELIIRGVESARRRRLAVS